MIPLSWSWLGRAPYREVWALQEARRERILAAEGGGADEERILLVEHEPVITLGRSADAAHVLDAGAVEVVRTNRGGDVTAHGPGQLVIYPVVRLTRGVRWHVETLGRAIADELRGRGVDATWRCAPAGVWVGPDKIAACGLHVRRGVGVHGFALNVTAQVTALFARIVPCGLAAAHGVTFVAAHAAAPALEELACALGPRLARALGRAPTRENHADARDLACDHARSR